MLDGESSESVAVACKFAVDVNTKALACMVAGAVLIPNDGEVVTMIEHVVEAEIIPFILRKQRIDLNSVVLTGAQATQTRDNQVVPRRVVVIATALLVTLQPITRGLVEVFADVGFASHVLALHVFFEFSEVEGVEGKGPSGKTAGHT